MLKKLQKKTPTARSKLSKTKLERKPKGAFRISRLATPRKNQEICAYQMKTNWSSSTVCTTNQSSVIDAVIILYEAQQTELIASRCCL